MSTAMMRRALHLALAILLALAVATPLAACGKKGDLEEPKGEKIQFPRNYPR